MSRSDQRVSEWLLERVALGELPPDELARARARIEAEPGGPERLRALERSNQEILESHTPARVVASIAARRRRDPDGPAPRRARMWLTVPALAAAAALVLWIGVGQLGVGQLGGGGPDDFERPDEIRLKGLRPHLLLYRQADPGAPLEAGALARAGDQLQLAYVAAGAAHGVLVSVDGGGGATLHFPSTPEQSSALGGPDEVRLPFAYELDDAPGFERFILVTATTPLEPARVLEAARALAADPSHVRTAPLPIADVAQHSLLLDKAP